MTSTSDTVFLLDVDNTLLDNDRVQQDLGAAIAQKLDDAERQRYWTLFESVRSELGYADYFLAMQQLRLAAPVDPRYLGFGGFLMDYPYAERVYPGALQTLAQLSAAGTTVILSDGDAVLQPRKILRSGLWDAVDGRVVVSIRKEDMEREVSARFPARRYVMIDDKLRILAAMKAKPWHGLTTVFVRQGHYAQDPVQLRDRAAADYEAATIADVAALPLAGARAA